MKMYIELEEGDPIYCWGNGFVVRHGDFVYESALPIERVDSRGKIRVLPFPAEAARWERFDGWKEYRPLSNATSVSI